MHRFALVAVLLSFAFSSLSVAQQSVPTYRLRTRSFADVLAEQRLLVGDYCRYDYVGLRLTPDGWKKMGPLTTMRTNPDFSSIIIVSRFQMDSPSRPTDNVSVSYLVIGRYDNGIGFSRTARTDNVNFHVVEKDGNLLISDMDSPNPHVSPRAAVTWLKERLARSTSNLEKDQIKKALDALQAPAS